MKGFDEATVRGWQERTGKPVRGLDLPANPPANRQRQPHLIRQQQSDKRNRAEQAFEAEVLCARQLRGEIVTYYEHEAIPLRLANGLKYNPDYPAIEINPAGGVRLVFFEVKGEQRQGRVRARDDAVVKIKQAAAKFTHFRFVLVWKNPATGEWLEQEVKS